MTNPCASVFAALCWCVLLRNYLSLSQVLKFVHNPLKDNFLLISVALNGKVVTESVTTFVVNVTVRLIIDLEYSFLEEIN